MGALHHDDFTEQMFKQVPRNMYLRTNGLRSADNTEREYKLYSRNHEKLISFRARRLPGCCGVLVVYYLRPTTDNAKRGIPLFQLVLNMIVTAAGLAKLGTVLMTQTAGSLGEIALVNQIECQVASFINWKTSNAIRMFSFPTVKPPEPPAKSKFDDEWSD